jgi:HK97 family phage major capsid protein
MTTLELTDNIEQMRKEAHEILSAGIKEQRALTDKEESKYNDLIKQINDKEAELKELKRSLENEKKNVNIIKSKDIKMEFRLIKAINDIANNRNLDETAQEVVKRGIEQMKKSGQNYGGQILLPIEERDIEGAITAGNNYTASTHNGGKENVATDVLNILEPLRANMVVSQAGAQFMTGLVGNVQIPVYGGSNVGWADETETAQNGTGNWSEVELSPKRLTAYIDVSKQFLVQDSNSAEEMLRRDIINAISEKLEQTVLGNGAGSTKQPKGLLNDVTADASAVTYADIVKMEADLEDKNVNNYTFICSPQAKATLKSATVSGSKSDIRTIMADNEIDGIKVYSTSAVAGKGLICGDFRDYVIGQWGAIDVTVDPYSQATNGKIRLVVNAYFDAKPRRAEAFSAKILK